MPKVSVIMPTFNRRNVIKKAIDSVLAQAFKDYELIIVDDGSTDGTEETLKETIEKNQNIHYFRQENKGASSARNFGISNSKGEFLAFLDTDNTWHPNFLEVMKQELENDEKSVMVYCSENLFLVTPNEEGKIKTIARKVRAPEYNPAKLLHTNYIDVNSILLKRKVIEDIGDFDENLSSLEDWDLFVRLAIKYPFSVRHVDQVLVDYYYSEHFDTVTNKLMPKTSIRGYMGLVEPDEATNKVLVNIQKYLSQKKVVVLE